MIYAEVILAAVKLVTAALQYLHDRRLLDQGKAEEIASALTRARTEAQRGQVAGEEAEARHAKDDTDAAFDPDFKRKD